MKRLLKKKVFKNLILYTGVAFILIVMCVSAEAAQKAVKYGWLSVETEDLEYDMANMKLIKDDRASGGAALAVQSNSVKESTELQNPSFKLNYTVETSGTYYVWLRAYYEFDGRNEGTNMFTDIAGTGSYVPKTLWFRERMGTYVWFKLGTVVCNEGTNQINIKYRMNNVVFDKLVVTNSAYFDPSVSPQMGEHPRLFVTKGDIPELVEKVHNPVISQSYDTIQKRAQTVINCALPDGNNDFTAYSKYDDIMIAKAFMYLIGEADSNLALEAIKNVRDFLGTVTFDKSDSTYASRYMGDTMVAAACVYDWCYDLLTVEDKKTILDGCLRLAGLTEVGYPPVNRGFVTSHGVEDLIYLHQLSISIAVYDEYPEWYSTVSDIIMTKMVPAKKFLNSSGNSFSSWAYGQARNNGPVRAEKMFTALGMNNSTSMFGEKYPDFYYMYIYGRLPNGVYFKEGDDYFWNRYKIDNRNATMGNLFRYMGGTYRDSILQQQGALDLDWVSYNIEPLDIIMSDFNQGKTDPTDLPLTRFTFYPMSTMIARTSWHDGLDAPTAMAYVNMRDITVGDHQHRDIGAFQFYYKGMLAIDSGFYEYSDHFANYQERSVAHNTVLIDDPDEPPYESYVQDGGQHTWRTTGETKIYEDIFKESKVTAESKAKYAGPSKYAPEFSYISSDISKAYTDKVEAFERSCVFLNLEDEDYPAAMIVYDNLKSKNANFKKTWLLHSEEEPEVNSDTKTTVIKRTQEGYNGKLVNKTLIPAVSESEITKVGGEGKEYYVNGINYDATIPQGVSADAGSWRIELSPKVASQEDKFLNVMYVCDADRDLPELPVCKIIGSDYTGTVVKDRMVTFSSSRDNILTGIEFEVPDTGYVDVKVLMTDMAAGKWKISGSGTEIVAESKNGEFCLAFDAMPGAYTVSPVEEAAEITPIATVNQDKEVFGDFYIRKNENLMYLAKPTKLINGIPYVAIDGIFTRIGETKILEKTDTSITLRNYGNTAEIKAGENWYFLNGERQKLEHPVKLINGTLYSGLEGFEQFLSIKSIAYSEYTRLLKFNFVSPEPKPMLKSLENAVFTTADSAAVEIYIPDDCTSASLSVDGKSYPIGIASTGYLKVKVSLEECAGVDVPVVLKYTVDGIEKSVSTTIGEVIDAGYTKILKSTDFKNATLKESDTQADGYSDSFKYFVGPLGTNNETSIAEFPAGNEVWKCDFKTIDGKGQTNILYYPSPKLGNGYYADIDFDVYAEKKNYRITAFLKGENEWPAQGGWIEYTPSMSNNNWHSVKYRVFPENDAIYVYVDGVYVSQIEVTELAGFSQIGVGIRTGYPNAEEPEAGALYIDNVKVTVGVPKYRDLTAKMNIGSKTISASFTGGSDAEGRNLGKFIISVYNDSCKLVGYIEKPIKATKNMLDTYTFKNTFSTSFVSAKAFLWSNDNKLIPLMEWAEAASETGN